MRELLTVDHAGGQVPARPAVAQDCVDSVPAAGALRAMAASKPTRLRLRALTRFLARGVVSHSWRRRTFQSARFDMWAGRLADLAQPCNWNHRETPERGPRTTPQFRSPAANASKKSRGYDRNVGRLGALLRSMTTPVSGPLNLIPASGGSVRSPRGQSYLLGKRLGAGAFGAVFDCIGPFDQSFALKVFLPGNRPYAEVRAEWL